MTGTTIRVQVAGTVRDYPQSIAAYGEHRAAGGQTVSLHSARQQARDFFRTQRDQAWKALTFWATLDDSGLAYRIDINRRGTHAITGAAPLPGPGNVQEVYVA